MITRSRSLFGWACYDFANSAFVTSVLTVIFSVYFVRVVVPHEGVMIGGSLIPGESLWSYMISLVMACVLVLSPVLGSFADERGWKRLFLGTCVAFGSIATLCLVNAMPGRWLYTLICVFIAALGFELSLVFYNAFLNDVANEDERGRVSGWGFALGYIGGGLCLGLNMALLQNPALFGGPADDSTWAVRMGMVIVGLWWAVFSLPTLLWVKDVPPVNVQRHSFVSHLLTIKQTWKSLGEHPNLKRFLIAFFLYDDAIQTVLLMASVFGAKAIGMSTASLAQCFLLIQFVAFVGAYVCGRWADAWSHKKVVMLTLFVYIGTVTWAIFMRKPWEFWTMGIIVGLVLGGSQAASRSFFSLLIPAGRTSEFYALFSIVGKAGGVVGPTLFGLAAQFVGLRAGVGSLLVLFIAGTALLSTVKEPAKR